MDIWRRQKTQLMRANVSVVCTRCINISLIQLSEPSYKAGSQPLTVNGTSYTQYCVTPLPHPCWFADSRGDMCAPHSPDFIPGVTDGQRGLPLGTCCASAQQQDLESSCLAGPRFPAGISSVLHQCEEKWVIRVTEACAFSPGPAHFSLDTFKSRCIPTMHLDHKVL